MSFEFKASTPCQQLRQPSILVIHSCIIIVVESILNSEIYIHVKCILVMTQGYLRASIIIILSHKFVKTLSNNALSAEQLVTLFE